MKRQLTQSVFVGLMTVLALGCNPPPSEPPIPPTGTGSDTNQDADRGPANDARSQPQSGVDVQVGGGEGVNVQVDPDQPGTNVDVGGSDTQ